MQVRHIFISPGHNYFGHHGQAAGAFPLVEVVRVECVAGRGLRGDRFFDHKTDYRGQVTLFAWDVFESLRRELPAPDAQIGALRRNIIVCGVDLNILIGTSFQLQGVELHGVEECRPCYWMENAVGVGAEAWLKGRGGLRCRILSDGEVTVG